MDSSVKNIDIHNFEAHWDKASTSEKKELIKASAVFDADLAIQLVLKGIDSYHFSIRTQARNTLKIIQARIHSCLQDPEDNQRRLKGMKDSTRACSRIFLRMKPGILFEEPYALFKTLLEFEGKGAHFAFKALCMRRISVMDMEKIIFTIPDSQRLEFIREYLQAGPELRLKFGAPFKQIVESIKEKNAVIKFLSRLFDEEQAVDPFLYNLLPGLRDPEPVISGFVRSESPMMRMIGLKALVMMVPKISPDLMIEILTNESDFLVRKTLYKIVENSSLGSYPEIFYPLLKLLEKSDEKEAFHAFKALIVSGKLPLAEVLEIVRTKHPNLMGHIYREISDLSRISFFFIQDIALNPESYAGQNIEINLAAAFGMIKKRPERVVEILKNHISASDNEIKKSVALFVKKTRQLLAREGRTIEKEFDAIRKKVEAIQPIKSEGLLKSFFSSTGMKKKLAYLGTAKNSPAIDFNGEAIINVDLSSTDCLLPAVYFSGSIIKDSDFSNASFSKAFFKKSILYNVDLENTRFDSVSFDGAVFINVNAKGAIFKNCSFQNICIYNCNFDRAMMRGAFFIGSTLSRSSFINTDLSCSLFAYSNIRAISFVHSNLEQADFNCIKSQFSKFPTHARPGLLKNDNDLNVRKYQLELSDMPEFDTALICRINRVIFGEFIHYGEKKFIRQNKVSLIAAFDIFKPRQADLFQMIPYLLHENIVIPGIKGKIHPGTPCGIFDYHPAPETIETISRYAPGKKFPTSQQLNPAIEGLFTIGSIGSIAQANDSDIDYWVCIREERLGGIALKLLQKKLHMLETYTWEKFHIQITFFIVDILKTRNNDFGDSTFESSGSAQAMLLKEEFYRTMIHVAGKLPLWSVLPTAISVSFYNDILETISTLPDFVRYIDLGDIHTIPTGEFFGASIWQMFKSLESPFKSVIKMALLEKYINEYGKKPLLCNIYKDEWMNSGFNLTLAQNDAYYVLLKNLLGYFEASGDSESVSLLLSCFFLKLGISKTAEIDGTVFGLRKILLEECLTNWGWSREKMFKIGGYKSWPYKNIAGLSHTIEAYMVKKYKTLNRAFEKSYQGKAMISPEDRTVLGRKVYSQLSRQPDKITKELLGLTGDADLRSLDLKYLQRGSQAGIWALINKGRKAGQAEILISAATIEEIGAWLIVNKIYNDSCVINLVPNPIPVTVNDIRKLFKALDDYFGPLIKKPVSFDRLLKKDSVAGLFVSVNFYVPRQQQRISSYTLIYMNTWGEMFYKSFHSEKGLLGLKHIRTAIQQQLNIKTIPANSACYVNGLLKEL